MRRPYSKDPKTERSLRHSVRDGVAHSIMSGAGESYFTAFALFLKASTAQIALLAALPPLLGSLAQLLSVWMGRRVQHRKNIMLVGVYLQCFLWLPLVFLPLLLPEYAVPIFIGLIVLYSATGQLIAPQWSSLMGELVPQRKRGRYFGMRTRYATVTSFIALVIAGMVLHYYDGHGDTLRGYIVVFMVAAFARLMSVYHVGQMHEPPRPAPVSREKPWELRAWYQKAKDSAAVRFSLFYALLHLGVSVGSPFFTVYILRDLKFSYLDFMCITATSVLMHFLTLQVWGRISDVFGNRLILVCTGVLIPLFPLLWLLSTQFWYLIFIQMIAGMVWSGFSLTATNFLYDTMPSEKRAQYMAFHNILAAVGVFLGALLGGALAFLMPIELSLGGHRYSWVSAMYGVFIVSALMRLLAVWIFLPRLREVRTVRPLSVRGLAFRMMRTHPVSRPIVELTQWLRRQRVVIKI